MSNQDWTLSGLHAAVRFTVEADCAPGLLSRVIEPFAKRDITPDRVSAQRQGEAMRVEIALARMEAGAVALVAGNLRQIVGVREVLLLQELTGGVRRVA